jgi:hypothetical protein
LDKYLPSGGDSSNLAGMGGVFNSLNFGMYTYGHQNPVKFTDPDGNATQAERDSAVARGKYEATSETLTRAYQGATSDLPVDNSYRYGSKGKNGYSDCSGYSAKLMPGLKGNASNQMAQTSPVDVEDIMPGDFVFLKTGNDSTQKADHVGLISGVSRNDDGKVIGYDVTHASSGKGKNIERITIGGSDSRSRLFNDKLVGFGTFSASPLRLMERRMIT